MKVIVPNRVQSIPAFSNGSNQPRLLCFIFCHEIGGACPTCLPHPPGDFSKNMSRRSIEHLLRGVQPQSIEMELIDPVAGIGEKKVPHWTTVLPVEINCLPPFVAVAVGEVIL